MKFFDRFKKKDEDDSNLKSIFTDLDGKKDNNTSQFDRFEQFKDREESEPAPKEDKIKYKTFDPYADDADKEESQGDARVITDDIINSVLSSVTDENAEGIVNETVYEDDFQEDATVITMDEDGNVDAVSEGIEIEIPEVEDEVIEETAPMDEGEVIDITDEITEEETTKEDKDIYENLFAETTIVGTQIYTYEIDKQLNGFNYKTDINYRVGMEESGIGSIFTITKKTLNSPISVQRHHTDDEVEYYNDLAGMGYSFAAVYGTKVQGVVLCEPQYWNNTLAIRYITVVEDARRNGIGKKLLAKCVEMAQHNGFRGLYAEIGSKNGSAIEFFSNNHFHITGTNTTLYTNSDMLKNQVGIFLYRAVI